MYKACIFRTKRERWKVNLARMVNGGEKSDFVIQVVDTPIYRSNAVLSSVNVWFLVFLFHLVYNFCDSPFYLVFFAILNQNSKSNLKLIHTFLEFFFVLFTPQVYIIHENTNNFFLFFFFRK